MLDDEELNDEYIANDPSPAHDSGSEEKMETIFGMITHLLRISLLCLHLIKICPLLNLTLLLSLNPLTSLQREQLLQSEKVPLEVNILEVGVIV